MRLARTYLPAVVLAAASTALCQGAATPDGPAENLARAAVPLRGEGVQDWFAVPDRPIVPGASALNDGKAGTTRTLKAGRNVVVGDNADDVRIVKRTGRIDAHDPRVRMRTADDRTVEHAGEPEVVGEPRLTPYLVHGVRTRDPRPDQRRPLAHTTACLPSSEP